MHFSMSSEPWLVSLQREVSGFSNKQTLLVYHSLNAPCDTLAQPRTLRDKRNQLRLDPSALRINMDEQKQSSGDMTTNTVNITVPLVLSSWYFLTFGRCS